MIYRVCGNYPTPYSKIYLDTFFAITFDRNNHTPRSWCHFKATNVSFKKTPRSRCIDVPNKSYGEKYPTIGGRIISAHPVYYISSGTSSKCSSLFPCDKNEIISSFCKDTYGSLPKLNISYIKTPNDHLKKYLAES